MPIEVKVYSSRKQWVEVKSRPATWQKYLLD